MVETGCGAGETGGRPALEPDLSEIDLEPGEQPWFDEAAQAWVATLEAAGVPVRRAAGPDDPGPEPSEDASAGSWLDQLERPELGPVSWLGELGAGARLVAELDALPGEMVDDAYEGIEVVAAWARVEAYAAARKRLAAAAVARRKALSDGLAALEVVTAGLGAVADPSTAADELGLRLGMSKRSAARLIESGRAFRGAGCLVGQALLDGEVDAAKADLIVSAIGDLDPVDAVTVQERVLERAAHLPVGRLRVEVNAACAGVATARWEEQCRAERATRRVCAPRALPFGMAGLYAVLPAAEAHTLYRAVDAAARSAKAHGDSRTMDQLRADALALMGSSAVGTGWIGQPPLDNPDVGTEADATADATAGAGVGAEADTGAPPGSAGIAFTVDGDGPELMSGDGAAGRAERARDTRGELCPPSMRVGVIGGRSAHVRVVVPLNALMTDAEGPDVEAGGSMPDGSMPDETVAGGAVSGGVPMEEVAHLEGYGPIPGQVARALAAGSTWARLVTDPVDGSMRELTSPRYRPPAAMADLVRAEKPVCIRPGCSVHADACDLNHAIPWPIGTTSVDGLDPACRRDHLLLTHAGWTYADEPVTPDGAAAPGRLRRRWRTGAGQEYLQHPDGTITRTGNRAIHPRSVAAGGYDPLDEPPF